MKITLKTTRLVNIIFYFLFTTQLSLCQDSDLLTSLIDNPLEEELSDPGWIDNLWELTEHPLNINQASLEDLLRIPFIDAGLAKQIFIYRSKVKEITSIEELLTIDGMSTELLAAVKPLLTSKPSRVTPRFLYRIRSRLDLPQKSGYLRQIYHNPLYLQQRILFQMTNKITGGVIWEKDPGEANFFDYGSIYVQYLHPEQKYSVLFGDFYQQYGCGLILWSPYGSPFSVHSLPTTKKSYPRAIGNKSSTESGYLRGFSWYCQFLPGIRINTFYSFNRRDGNLSADKGGFTSLYTSGFHRTEKEIEDKGNIQEKMAGVSLVYHLKDIQLQICALLDHFTPDYEKSRGTQIYQSVAYSKTGKNFQPAGEYVLFQYKYPAFQQSFYYTSDQLKFELVGYYYHPRFFSFHGHAVGSLSSFPQNRSGTAMIINHKIFSRFRIGGYLHFYHDLVLFQEISGIHRDYFGEIFCKLTTQQLRIRFQQNYRPIDERDINIYEKRRNILRFDYSFQILAGFEIKNSLQLSWAKPLPTNHHFYGTSLYHQLTWKSKKVIITSRWTGFEVSDYDLRLYESEPDLSGTTRSILLNERGYKFLLLFQLRLEKMLEMDFKYGQRYYPDLKSIGSGLDLVPTNRIHEIKISILRKIR
jgi:hypothetical protein